MWKIFSGLLLGWGLGSNDSANIFGPAVAEKVIKYRAATILIAIFVIIGALNEGPKCMVTLGNLSQVKDNLQAFVILLSSAIVAIAIARIWGIPISTSQSVVGSILGSLLFRKMFNENIDLGNSLKSLYKILICWVGTPIGGIIVGFLLYHIF